MTNESQMKPKDWADAHGLKVDVVMKLLRDAGVAVRTHMSKLDMADFEKIEEAAAAEKQKQDARNKNLKKASTSESDSSASAPAKKKETSVATNKLGLKVSLKKGPGARKEAPKAVAKQDPKSPVAKPAAPAVKPAAPAPAPAAPAAKPAAPAAAPVAPAPKPAAPAAPAPAPAAPAAPAPKPAAPAPAVKPAAPAPKPVPAQAPAQQPTMMSASTELKQPPMKAQVFKPDAAILARIEKSRQQAQASRGGHRPNNGPRNGNGNNNGQGYTGTFGRLSNNNNGGNDNRNNNNNNRRPNGGNASSSSRGYTGRNGGFSSGSMQEAFNASNGGQALGQNNQNGKGNGKGQNGRHNNDKNRRSNTKDRQEMQKEQQQEAVRQNVSRVMASLSKNPVKKVYHKDHSENNTGEEKKILKTSDFITVGELAGLMDQMPARVIAKCMEMGMMVTINARLDFETIQILADEFGYEAQLMEEYEEEVLGVEEESEENLQPRHPVVTVMGHVDHGKTSLLDWIRKTHVVSGESGGITQHIGAYEVTTKQGKVTFLDTPGHEAFTAMRSRGAQATDVVILIVAADDGVMPQTVEAINHAKAANVPIIVAINKIDKPTANPAKVKNELLKYEIVAEELGGENLFVEISAKQRINIEGLLEAVLLQVEMMDLKADPTKPAEGIVIESRMDPGKGPVATVLVKDGTLKIGDLVVTGTSIGYVRSMMDWTGKRVKEATPSMAVEITGLDLVPPAGEKLYVFKDERKAKGLVELRINKQREKKNVEKATPSIEEFFAAEQEEVKDLNVIVKGDVDGSVEAIIASLNKIEHKKMKIKVIHSGVGGINENDVLLASASQGMIIGFNVRVDNKAKQLAAAEGVNIEIFSIIYELIDAIKAAMSGMLAPIIKEEYIGKLEVREIFKVGKVGTIAGCMVIEGRVVRMSKIKLVRDNVVIYSGKLGTLKRFKDDVKEVKSGYECGATIDSYNDIKVGDIIECYIDKEFRDEVL